MFSEHDLCNQLIKVFENTEFRVFPEYQGWDLVINRGRVLLGVQAKLDLNFKVMAQTIRSSGTHFKAVLTDNYKAKLHDDKIEILNELGIMLINHSDGHLWVMNEYKQAFDRRWLFKWRQPPETVMTIPDFDYYVRSGVASPNKVTERNINLVKLELFALEHGGKVTLGQVRSFGFYRVPRFYFYYEARTKLWVLNENPKRRPSADYPHIFLGLTK